MNEMAVCLFSKFPPFELNFNNNLHTHWKRRGVNIRLKLAQCIDFDSFGGVGEKHSSGGNIGPVRDTGEEAALINC